MDVTIAICTWNRARFLGRTLEHFRRLRIPHGLDWELLIVENNCTDETPAVIQSFADCLPIVREVEPVLGLARARNRALDVARGDLVIFTDDDVLVDEDWLVELCAAAERWPDAAYFGGLITPLYVEEPPPWYRANERILKTFVGEGHDLGETERVLGPKEFPWGPSMAYRRVAFEKIRFRSDIGRRGRERADREDEVYGDQLVKAGFRGVWVPSAKVQHVVGPEHLTLDLVRRNYMGQAMTTVRLSEWDTEGSTLLFGVPRWMILSTAKAQLKYVWRRGTRHPAWFESFIDASRKWGELSEYWRHRRRRETATDLSSTAE